MNIIFLMLFVSLVLGGGFLAAFLWFASQGEYDDLETPAQRILLPESTPHMKTSKERQSP